MFFKEIALTITEFFPVELWPKRVGHKSKGKNEDLELTVRTEKTRLVKYYYISEVNRTRVK